MCQSCLWRSVLALFWSFLNLTRYHFNGYVSVSLRHISSQLNSTGTKRAIYSTCPDPFLPPRSGKGSAKVWLARLVCLVVEASMNQQALTTVRPQNN